MDYKISTGLGRFDGLMEGKTGRGTFVGPLCAAAAATDVTRNGRKRRAEVRKKWRGRRERERESKGRIGLSG